MDFLGSIMGSMDAAKPKQAPMSEKDKLKKKQEEAEKADEADAEKDEE